MAAIVRRLPFGLARVVAPNMLGFAVISAVTFSLNLVLLVALHGGLRWPVPVSITLAYLAGTGLGYVLNRSLNFRSHGAVGPQVGVYTGVAAVNYFAWILGVGAGLAAVGVDYRLARIIAGACESVYMYAAMRWLVFRDAPAGPAGEGTQPGGFIPGTQAARVPAPTTAPPDHDRSGPARP
jgi:putative flippase GtrA